MLLVDGIRPILPLIRNTPYGKRIQSKLQREQMDSHHHHYGGYNQAHAALVNLALTGSGIGMNGGTQSRHVSQGSMHHYSPLSDAYTARSSLYNIAQTGGLQSQQIHPGLQHGIEGYGSPHHMIPGSASQTPMPNGFQAANAFSSPVANTFGGNVGVAAGGMNDPYQRQGFAYGI